MSFFPQSNKISGAFAAVGSACCQKASVRRKGDKALGSGLGALQFLSYPAQTPGESWLHEPYIRRVRTATERKADDAWWSFCLQNWAQRICFRRCSGHIDRRVSDHRLRPAGSGLAKLRAADRPALRHLSHGLCGTYAVRPPLQDRRLYRRWRAYRSTLFPADSAEARTCRRCWPKASPLTVPPVQTSPPTQSLMCRRSR